MTPDLVARCNVAARWLMDNKERLDSDWAELRGTLTAIPGVEKGSYWAVRYDAQVLYVDPQGKITKYAGLDRCMPQELIGVGTVIPLASGTIYVTNSQVYLLDSKLGRWVPTFAAMGWNDGSFTMWDTPATPAVLKYVTAKYPASGTGRELLWSGKGAGNWHWWTFNGNIGIVANKESGEVIDLSIQLATLAHKDKPVKVYRLTPVGDITPESGTAPEVTGRRIRAIPVPLADAQPQTIKDLLIPTDCGLWTMDEQGKLARVPLGDKPADVPVLIMSWPHKEGKAYIGTAPQDGGKVYEFDIATGKCTLTGGQCFSGIEDAYFVLNTPNHPRSNYYAALSAIYAKAHP